MKFYKTEDEAAANGLKDHGCQPTFEGHNCHDVGIPECDACMGWDGESRRCDCGNRRVYWEGRCDDAEQGFYAVATAY